MTNSTKVANKQRINKIYYFILLSVLFTTYLCYIDEGYYNFEWMKDAGNWLMFAIYVSIFTGLQWLIYSLSKADKKAQMK